MNETIPIEVLFQIFHYLAFFQLFQVERTCRDFRDVAHSLMWSWKKIEKPHTTFKRVYFVSDIKNMNSSTWYFDERLLIDYKNDLSFLFKYCFIMKEQSGWFPQMMNDNLFEIIDVNVRVVCNDDFLAKFSLRWSPFDGVIKSYHEVTSLYKTLMDAGSNIDIVHPLVIKR